MRRNSRVNKFLIPGAQSDTVRDQKGLSVTECDFVTIPPYNNGMPECIKS